MTNSFHVVSCHLFSLQLDELASVGPFLAPHQMVVPHHFFGLDPDDAPVVRDVFFITVSSRAHPSPVLVLRLVLPALRHAVFKQGALPF